MEPHRWGQDNRASNSGHHKSGRDDGRNACKGHNSGLVPAWCGTGTGSALSGMGWVSSPIPGDTNATGGNDPRTTRHSTGIPTPGIRQDCRIYNPRTSSRGTAPSSSRYGRAAGSGCTRSSMRGTDTPTAGDARDTGRPSGRHHSHEDSRRWWAGNYWTGRATGKGGRWGARTRDTSGGRASTCGKFRLGWESQFLVPISGTPIGSGILILFLLPKIPAFFFFEFRC